MGSQTCTAFKLTGQSFEKSFGMNSPDVSSQKDSSSASLRSHKVMVVEAIFSQGFVWGTALILLLLLVVVGFLALSTSLSYFEMIDFIFLKEL